MPILAPKPISSRMPANRRTPSGSACVAAVNAPKSGDPALGGEDEICDQQGDGSGFQNRQHEEHWPAGFLRPLVRHDHHGTAKAHHLVGDEERHAVLQAGDTIGAKQTHCRTEAPAAPRCRVGPGDKDQNRSSKAEAKQPGGVRIEQEMRTITIRSKRQREGQRCCGKLHAAQDHPGNGASSQKYTRHTGPKRHYGG